MAWQSTTINPTTTSPAVDISKITNDLSVLKGVLEGTPDAAIADVKIERTNATGSAKLPAGTTAQRDASPQAGWVRFNTDTGKEEVYNGTAWTPMGSGNGATGGGNDAAFVENDAYITSNYTLGQNGQAACTISIASPAVVTQQNTYVGGEAVFFMTTGALPTGLSASVAYYVLATGLSSLAFRVSATRGGAAINTSGSQSGTHTCGKLKNASLVGPMVVASGKVVSVPTGARLVVL
jgi:hypothetical protein